MEPPHLSNIQFLILCMYLPKKISDFMSHYEEVVLGDYSTYM